MGKVDLAFALFILSAVCFADDGIPGATRKLKLRDTEWSFKVVLHEIKGDHQELRMGTINSTSVTGYDSLGLVALPAAMGGYMLYTDSVNPIIAASIIPVGIVFNQALAYYATPKSVTVQGTVPFQPPQPPDGKQPIVYSPEELKGLLDSKDTITFRKGTDGKLYLGKALGETVETVAPVEQPVPPERQQPFNVTVKIKRGVFRQMQRVAQGTVKVYEGEKSPFKQFHIYVDADGVVKDVAAETMNGKLSDLSFGKPRRHILNPLRTCTAAFRFLIGLP